MRTQTYEGSYARLTTADVLEILAKLMALAAAELAADAEELASP